MALLKIWWVTTSLQSSCLQIRNQTAIQFLDSRFAFGRKEVVTGFHCTFINSLFLCCLLPRCLVIPTTWKKPHSKF